VVDAPPHKISIGQTVAMAKDFGAAGAVHLHSRFPRGHENSRDDEGLQPQAEGGLRRAPVTTEPEKTLRGSTAIDFVVRREFDRQIVDYANGKPLEDLPGVSYRKTAPSSTTPKGRLSKTWMRSPG